MELAEQVSADEARALSRVPVIRAWNAPLLRWATGKAKGRGLRGVTVENVVSPHARVRLYRPTRLLREGPTPALLWIHGGGLVIGAPGVDDHRCARFARELGMVVVSAYYRLAPRDPFPAAIDDVHAAWRWLVEESAALNVDAERRVIGGESAGGGLAACLAQRLLDEGDAVPRGQLLVYPMLDDRTALRDDLAPREHLVWSNTSNRFGWSSYLGPAHGAATLPDYAAAARRASLSALPSTWIGVGTEDLFYDECCAYAARLEEANVDCQLDVVRGAPHGFEVLLRKATATRAFIAAQLGWLRATLAI